MKKIVFVLLLITLFSGFAFPIKAFTESEKQALIAQIKQKIVELQAQLSQMIASENLVKKSKESFDVSLNSKFSNQSILPPRTNFKIASFTLTNNTSEQIDLQNLELDLFFGSDSYTANMYISNLYIVYGDVKTQTIQSVSYINNFPVSVKIDKSKTLDVSVFADAVSSIQSGSVLQTGLMASGVSVVSQTKFYTNSKEVFSGQKTTFGASSVNISADNSVTYPKIVMANQNLDVAKFKITSTADSINITNLKMIVLNYTPNSVITSAVLKDADTKNLITPNPVPLSYDKGQYFFDFTNINIAVGLNTSKSIIVSYNLGNIVNADSSNTNIAPIVVYLKATNSQGDNVEKTFDGVKSQDIYAYKTTPIFQADSNAQSLSSGSVADLYNFKIKADLAGDISVKQLTFSVTISDPNKVFPSLSNFKFFKDGIDYTSMVTIGKNVNNVFINPDSQNGLGIGAHNLIVILQKEELIPAGKSTQFVLKATLNNFRSSASVSTHLLADSITSTTGSYLRAMFNPVYGLTSDAKGNIISYYNFLWSDRSANRLPDHNDQNGFSSKDWYNGYGITSLPTSSQVVRVK